MKVTKIERQKKNIARRSIYLDDQYALGISEETFLKHGLHVDQELTKVEIENIEQQEKGQSVKRAALRFRSYRPRSKKEIEDHLIKKGFEKKNISSALEYLNSQKLINDEEFARMYARDKIALRSIGKVALKTQLLKKGISKNVIEKVIEENYPESKELELALKEANKKLIRVKKLPFIIQKQKIYTHLLRKGYNSSLSHSITNQLFKNNV